MKGRGKESEKKSLLRQMNSRWI